MDNLDNLSAAEDYFKVVGRIHRMAGVDPKYFDRVAEIFCRNVLANLSQASTATKNQGNNYLWDEEVKTTWGALIRTILVSIKKGYECDLNSRRPSSLLTEERIMITDVWAQLQEHVMHYLGNSLLLLPLVMRSNRTISKYFATYEATLDGFTFEGESEVNIGCLDKTKHGIWFLNCVLTKVIPCLESFSACTGYLQRLGEVHKEKGVLPEHLDLLGLVYTVTIRAVVAGQGNYSNFLNLCNSII